MPVLVRVPSALRELAGGEATLSFDVAEGATVADVLERLRSTHPALERRVRDERGVVRTHVNVFVGESNIRDLGGTSAVLPAVCELTIIAAVSGGGP